MRKFLQVIKEIGKGGESTIYLARDTSKLQEDLAVKLFNAREPSESTEFEQHLIKLFDHPNIVKFIGHIIDDYASGVVFELLSGLNLRSLVNRLRRAHKAIKLETVQYIAREILFGLNYLHNPKPVYPGQGILHNDLTPENIFLQYSGVIKIVDFGAASLIGKWRSKQLFGKRSFLAPELLKGDSPTPRSELYSFGVCMFELITLERFRPHEIQTMRKLIRRVTTQNDSGLSELIWACLADKPYERPINAARALMMIEAPKKVTQAAKRELIEYVFRLAPAKNQIKSSSNPNLIGKKYAYS